MTLHRAKGLEFDVVVMPALARPAKRRDPELLIWRQRPAGLLLAPTSPTSVDRNDRDPIYAYLRALDAAEDASELARLLYVGCTRARRSLHLTARLNVDRDANGRSRWKQPARGSSLDALWAAVQTEAPLPPEEPAAAARGTVVSGVPLLRLPLAWRLPPPPSMQLAPAAEAQRGTEPVEFDWVRETARQIGTVAHRLLLQLCQRRMRDHRSSPVRRGEHLDTLWRVRPQRVLRFRLLLRFPSPCRWSISLWPCHTSRSSR